MNTIDEIDSIEARLQQKKDRFGEEAFRLLHGRGKTISCLEEVNIDYLPPVLLVTLYATKTKKWIDRLTLMLKGFEQCSSLVIQDRSHTVAENEVMYGSLPKEHFLKENGLMYQIDVLKNQNIGFFLDMRPGRDYVARTAQNKRVLNTFAYTCSFSVCAMQAGAELVVNMDMKKNFLSRGRDNHRFNGHDLSKVFFYAGDLMKSKSRMKKHGPYDLMILDPPFKQHSSFDPDKDYARCLRLLTEMSRRASEIMLCVNDPKRDTGFIEKLMAPYQDYDLIESLEPCEDFPEAYREEALKIQIYRKR